MTGGAGFGTAGVLSGHVRLAGDSAIKFKSGEITSLAANAQLRLNGPDAFIEDSTALGKNSALTGLASIGAGALFGIHNKAAVSTSGSLANDGTIRLDFVRGDGGSSLTVGGTLTNSGSPSNPDFLVIGNSLLSASDKVTAAALDNTGVIQLTGSSANQALLDVTGGAGFGTAGVLSGTVQLSGDSAIEFASGQITSLAASSFLELGGSDAFIEDSSAPGSNSALAGLAEVAGNLELDSGASLSTRGALTNNGVVSLGGGISGSAGSSLTVAGTLTNSGTLSGASSGSAEVTAASLDNTGSISLVGFFASRAVLDVTGSAGFGAAGVLSGTVQLSGGSAIEFASGEITSLAAHATLSLNGNRAFIEDSTAPGSNSALTGLASIDQGARFDLENTAAVSTTGALVNDGNVQIDLGDVAFGGSSLTVAGTLTNSNHLSVGNAIILSASDKVTAAALDNTGEIDLFGRLANFAALDVAGATTNNGSISIVTDTEELAGAVGGAGSFSLSNSNLQFDSSVSAGQTITETGMDALTLKHAQDFAATISGFGTKDTIDAANFLLSATTFKFVENSAMTGGTLTLTDGSLTANIQLTGDYTNSDFTLAADSGTGTLVKFV